MGRCGVSRCELCFLHLSAPSAPSQGTWMMPVPLPTGASLNHPPALSSLPCPLAPHSLAQPFWALPGLAPRLCPLIHPLSPGCQCWRRGVGLFLGMFLSCLHVCFCQPVPMEPRGCPVHGSLLGHRAPMGLPVQAAVRGGGWKGWGGRWDGGRSLAWQQEQRGNSWEGVILRGERGLRGCPGVGCLGGLWGTLGHQGRGCVTSLCEGQDRISGSSRGQDLAGGAAAAPTPGRHPW